MGNITEELQRIIQAKADIKKAIEDKGVTVGDINISGYADKIKDITTGGGGSTELPEILDTDPLTFVRIDKELGEGYISLNSYGSVSNKLFEYNKNNEGWKTYKENTFILMNYGDKIQFRSNSTTALGSSISTYRTFATKGLYNCGGKINSLINNSNTAPAYCFYNLFNLSNIINAPILPCNTLNNYCYARMFSACTSLINAPALPATTLSSYCYLSMFLDCISLVNAPALPATSIASYCYSNMFNNCKSLGNAPALPATKLVNYCYEYMFSACTSLINAPALPATTLANYCYEFMFSACTSLINAPALPATTLATYCYYFMFYNCTSLINAPALPAERINYYAYNNMFSGCTHLTTIYCYARYITNSSSATGTSINTTWTNQTSSSYPMYNWLSSAKNTTTCIFYKNPNFSGPTSRSVHTIPSNWQIQDWTDYPNT